MARRIGDDYVYPLPEFASLPPIPPAHQVDRSLYMGPTEESNWVLFPVLLVGAYPSSMHDPTNTAILTSILGLGVTTFVCLQLEYQHEGVTEEEWRSGAKLRPYIFDAVKLVDTLPASFWNGRPKIAGLEFVHFPILDCGVAHDASVLQLARDLCGRLLKGEVMYLVRGVGPPQPNKHTRTLHPHILHPIHHHSNPPLTFITPHTHNTPPFSTAGAGMGARAQWYPSCWALCTALHPCRPCAGCSLCTTSAWLPWALPHRRQRHSASRLFASSMPCKNPPRTRRRSSSSSSSTTSTATKRVPAGRPVAALVAVCPPAPLCQLWGPWGRPMVGGGAAAGAGAPAVAAGGEGRALAGLGGSSSSSSWAMPGALAVGVEEEEEEEEAG